MAHRLELSLKDALNSTPLKDIDKMLVGVYNYVYEKSPKKRRKLEGVIQKLRACLEEGEIPHKRGHRPLCSCGTRFVAHKVAALESLM